MSVHFNRIVLVVIAVGLTGPAAWAADTFVLQAKLSRQAVLLEEVKPLTERQDLPQLLVLERVTQRTRDSLRTLGAAHMETMQGFEELVISTRFSKNLLSQTRTVRTAARLDEIQRIGQELARSTGMDQSPYTRITVSVYDQVHQLNRKLLELELPEALRRALTDLEPRLGRLIATAREGDHSRTFALGSSVQGEIATLYPLFETLVASNAAFLLVLEVQGLNEYYAQFAQIRTGQ